MLSARSYDLTGGLFGATSALWCAEHVMASLGMCTQRLFYAILDVLETDH